MLRIVAAQEGSATIPMGVDARVGYGLLVLRGRAAASEACAAWLEVPGADGGPGAVGELELPGGRVLRARLLPAPEATDLPALARAHGLEWDGESVLLDAAAAGIDATVGGRLWVDGPRPGDVLCPLGMHGQSKKLSDLLNSARVPAAEKPSVPVVRTAPAGAVVWVAGVRADERCRVVPATRILLELTLANRVE